MNDIREASAKERLREGVFQPSRAEIAHEMKCRLDLGLFDRRRPRNRKSGK